MKVECAVPSPHSRLCTVGHPVFQAGAKVSLGHLEEKVPGKQGQGSMGMGSPGKEVDVGSRSSVVFPQGRLYYYPIRVLCPQVTFLLEFEFSCTFLLNQVFLRLTASR